MRVRFEPLAWEYEEFKFQLDQVLRPFHEAAIVELQKIHSQREKELQEAMREADQVGDEGEWQLQRDYARLEEETAKERERLSGWLVLVYLVILLNSKLDRLKSFLDRSHPPKAKYTGKSWLEKMKNEYRARFGIDFQGHPQFPLIQEVVIARNAVVHNAGKPTREYLALPKRRFLEKITKVDFVNLKEQEVIVLSNRDFKEILMVLDEFMDWLVRELRCVRDGRRPVGPLRGAEFVR
jgi:hypothetical protein